SLGRSRAAGAWPRRFGRRFGCAEPPRCRAAAPPTDSTSSCPMGDDAYYAARPTIAIAKPGAEEGAVALDGHFGLHPALSALIPLWQEKQLAFVHAAGSPDPTRSHFAAQLFIENGTPGTNTTPDGWLNRLLAAVPGVSRGPTDAVAVGPTLPHILKGRIPAANLPLGPAPATPLAIDKPEIASAFDPPYARK